MNAKIRKCWFDLARFLDLYTDDCGLSGINSYDLNQLVAIPKEPSEFDQDLWDELNSIKEDDLRPDDIALLVRLAVLKLQDEQVNSGLKRRLVDEDGKAADLWGNLCDAGRPESWNGSENRIGRAIFGFASDLEKVARKMAGPLVKSAGEGKKKTKRKTPKQNKALFIASLTKHHGYESCETGSVLNTEPIRIRETGISAGAASRLFDDYFEGHQAYTYTCMNKGKLIHALKILRGEVKPKVLNIGSQVDGSGSTVPSQRRKAGKKTR